MTPILITGALGQVGTELTLALRACYGPDAILATDIRAPGADHLLFGAHCEPLDCTDERALLELIMRHDVRTVYHLAALLSATAETRVLEAWQVNMGGLLNVLEVAQSQNLKVFVPSSIAAFGPTTPRDQTPQDTLQRPNTIYGVTKVAGELLCDYYHSRFGLDVRGLRYPGLLSHHAPPGGGTTDYAVDIFRAAAKGEPFRCPLEPQTALPMMYMPDAIRATLELMNADPTHFLHRNAFNIAGMTFTPEEVAREIRHHLPQFELQYDVEPVKQRIARSWPRILDDSAARTQWGWKPHYDLSTTTTEMLAAFRETSGLKV